VPQHIYANGVEAAITYLSEYDPAATVTPAAAAAYVATNPYVAGTHSCK